MLQPPGREEPFTLWSDEGAAPRGLDEASRPADMGRTATKLSPARGGGGSPGKRCAKDTVITRMIPVAPMPPPKTISESNRWLSRFAGHRLLRQSEISTLLQISTCVKSGGNLMAHEKGNKSIRTESLFVYVSCHEHHHEQQQQQVYVQAPFIYIIKLPSRFVAQGHPCLSVRVPNSH